MAGECAMENAVGMAAMVKADRLQMQVIARELSARLQTEVVVGGVEANMAIAGALTTPGCAAPLAILDLGAGSTDAAIVNAEGADNGGPSRRGGDMVSLLIKTELGLEDLSLAEAIKKYPLAKVESLFSIRHENGAVEFFREALSPAVFAKVVYIKEGELVPIDNASPLEKNSSRAPAGERESVCHQLPARAAPVSPGGSIRDIAFVVLVGGSSLDFEIPQLITEALSHYGVVAGQGNIREQKGRAMRSPPGCYWPVRRIKRALAPASLFNVLFQDADNEPDFYLNRAVRGRVSWHRIAHFLRRGLRRCAAGRRGQLWSVGDQYYLGPWRRHGHLPDGRCLRRAPKSGGDHCPVAVRLF